MSHPKTLEARLLAAITAGVTAMLESLWDAENEAPFPDPAPIREATTDAPAHLRGKGRYVGRIEADEIYRAWEASDLPERARLGDLMQRFGRSETSIKRVVRGGHQFSPMNTRVNTRHQIGPKDVAEIMGRWRQMKNQNGADVVRLAMEFGVSSETIRRIARGAHRFSPIEETSNGAA